MTGAIRIRVITAASAAVILTASGCAFEGLNSLPLPGAAGQGSGANTYHVEFANIGTLESNSPVLINDVVVGSVKKMTFSNWHVDVDVAIEPDVVVPANAVGSIGQTSLLGSMHLALDPPVGQPPSGRLTPGATIPLDRSSAYPSTEQTLSALSTVVNGGGLGQIGDIIHNFNAALNGREGDVRELLTRLDDFVGVLDAQRANIIATLQALNRLGGTFAAQSDVIERVLQKVPPALEVLVRERPRITTALDKLRVFSDTTTELVDDTKADLVTDLQHLEPTIRALADVGDGLDHALASAGAFPYGQAVIDRGLRGDYMNLFDVLDFTVPRLKRTTFLGTRWGEDGAVLVPAPGEPYYLNYAYDPLLAPIAPPPAGIPAPPPIGAPPPIAGAPPADAPAAVATMNAGSPVPQPGAPIFAGPYGGPPAAPASVGGGG